MGLFNLGMVTKKENGQFKPVKFRLKIDLLSHSAREERLDKYTYEAPSENRTQM